MMPRQMGSRAYLWATAAICAAAIAGGMFIGLSTNRLKAAQLQPAWSVDVLSSLNLDNQQQQLYQNMATVLSQ